MFSATLFGIFFMVVAVAIIWSAMKYSKERS